MEAEKREIITLKSTKTLYFLICWLDKRPPPFIRVLKVPDAPLFDNDGKLLFKVRDAIYVLVKGVRYIAFITKISANAEDVFKLLPNMEVYVKSRLTPRFCCNKHKEIVKQKIRVEVEVEHDDMDDEMSRKFYRKIKMENKLMSYLRSNNEDKEKNQKKRHIWLSYPFIINN